MVKQSEEAASNVQQQIKEIEEETEGVVAMSKANEKFSARIQFDSESFFENWSNYKLGI